MIDTYMLVHIGYAGFLLGRKPHQDSMPVLLHKCVIYLPHPIVREFSIFSDLFTDNQ